MQTKSKYHELAHMFSSPCFSINVSMDSVTNGWVLNYVLCV